MSVTAAPGFVAAGIACGIKASGAADLALVATDDGAPVPAAAVFTSNRSTAAPVVVSRAHLASTGGHAAGVVLNSGNANAATGAPGREAAERMCAAAAAAIGAAQAEHLLVCSTGLIGIPLEVEKIVAAAPALATARAANGGAAAAAAIMTTDTHPKQVVVHGDGFTLGGMAKGAAMLAPNMATMLAVLTTDAAAEPEALTAMLQRAVAASFNTLSVDGCTSTNDTVIVLANGRAGAVDPEALQQALTAACTDLAEQMAGDAEGATKVVRVRVTGATSDEDAAAAARKVAESQLCKCSWYGRDPYWGRILSEVGSAGVDYDPELASVSYGGIVVAERGVAVPHDAEAVRAHMAERHLVIDVDLRLGSGSGAILTNDLTHAYVDENMGTS